MPGMDGIELCRKIRAIKNYKDTPIIMLTAMSDRTNIDQAFAAGATDYVTKPFDVTEIGARVRIAEKLHVAQTAAIKHRDAAASLTAVNDTMVKLPFLEPQHFQGIDGAVEYEALTNYLGQLSKTGLYSSNIFAVKIDAAAELHGLSTPQEYSHALTTVAGVLSKVLKTNGFFLMSYAGCGHFVCVANGVYNDFEDETEQALQQAVATKKLDMIMAQLWASRFPSENPYALLSVSTKEPTVSFGLQLRGLKQNMMQSKLGKS